MEERKVNKPIEERIEEVLDSIRPFLQSEGGDISIDHFDSDTGICYVDMVGACQGCSFASYDISDTIEVLLTDAIEEISHVELVQPKRQTLEDLLNKLNYDENKNKDCNTKLNEKVINKENTK